MHRLGSGVLTVTMRTALAQSPTPPFDVEATGSLPVALTPIKQREIKTSLANAERGLAFGEQLPRVPDELRLRTIVPPSVPLSTLPQDAIAEVPSTSSYRFVLMKDGIAVIDPATRGVLQVIK
jgi:Protein of unknown function (DUF1236)